VKTKGLGGSGTLAGVASLASTNFDTFGSYCAVLASGGADCWGDGYDGQLGNGLCCGSYSGSTIPVKVKGVGGSGSLTGVVAVRGSLGDGNFCAFVTSGVGWTAAATAKTANSATGWPAIPTSR
jgi:hypothetical protein